MLLKRRVLRILLKLSNEVLPLILLPLSLTFREFHKVAAAMTMPYTDSAFPEPQQVDSDYQIEELCQEHMTLPCCIDTLAPNRSVLYNYKYNKTLYSILLSTGNQCSSLKTGVMFPRRSLRDNIRAAKF